MECLHHRKEIARVNTILAEAKRQDDISSGVLFLSTHTPPFPPPSFLKQEAVCKEWAVSRHCIFCFHLVGAATTASVAAPNIAPFFKTGPFR